MNAESFKLHQEEDENEVVPKRMTARLSYQFDLKSNQFPRVSFQRVLSKVCFENVLANCR